MIDYKPFLVANARSGFNESLEPWLIPRDGYQLLQNAHLYRGVIEKINGYALFAKMTYTQIVEMEPVPDGIEDTFTVTLSGPIGSNSFIGQGAINAGMTTKETFQYLEDASDTLLNLVGSDGGTGTIDLTDPNAPLVTLIFNTPPVTNVVGGVEYNTVIFTYDGPPPLNMAGQPDYKPIMGIKPYYQNAGGQDIIVFDTRRAAKVVPIISVALGALLGTNNGMTELPHEVQDAAITFSPPFDGVTLTFSGTIPGPLVPGEVTITLYDNTGTTDVVATDEEGAGALSGTGVTSGFVNYATGEWTITFVAAPAADQTLNSTVCIYGDTFTGTFSDFFSVDNWQTLATANATEADNNLLFITNNVDPIRYWNGFCLKFLNTNLEVMADNVIAYDISRCLFVLVYQSRLLLISVVRSGNPELNNIYWSSIEDPLVFTNNEFLPAPTSEPIRAQGEINNDLIVRFAKSERLFRYTQDQNSPFRWDGVNSIYQCDSSFSTINYDYYMTTVGKPAIVASDGQNVTRADDLIPDFTDPNRIDQTSPARFLDQTSIRQCYGERFDDLKEGWMCYASMMPSTSDDIVNPSDSVLAFNYTDHTWAVYTFPFSCLGLGTILSNLVWGNDFRIWDSISDAWGSYQLTLGALIDLAGDQFGNVFELDTSYTQGTEKVSLPITGVSNAAAAVITSIGHNLSSGDQVTLQEIESVDDGLEFLNNHSYVVTVLTADTFSIPIDTSTSSAYTTGGIWFTAPVVFDLISKNFTPFAEEGQLTRLGYVDLLVSANNQTKLRVQFFKDDQLALNGDGEPTNFYLEVPLTFTDVARNSTTPQTKVWKRIYCGCVAKEHTLRIYQNLADFTSDTLDQPIRIHAMCLYMKPAGRIFN